jgi:D-lactate dehydrogenase (cytochrome)
MTIAAATDKLAALPGNRLVASREVPGRNGQNATCQSVTSTDVVAFPETAGEVSAILKLCKVEQCPVMPSGATSSQAGRQLCRSGGKSRVMVPMNRVFQVSEEDLIEFSEPPQGYLKDTVRLSLNCPAWPFGTGALMRKPTARGLL